MIWKERKERTTIFVCKTISYLKKHTYLLLEKKPHSTVLVFTRCSLFYARIGPLQLGWKVTGVLLYLTYSLVSFKIFPLYRWFSAVWLWSVLVWFSSYLSRLGFYRAFWICNFMSLTGVEKFKAIIQILFSVERFGEGDFCFSCHIFLHYMNYFFV